jgi:cytochrome P450
MVDVSTDVPLLLPRSEEFLGDPHGVYDGLRAAGGLVADPIGWSAISYQACEAAFHDPALSPGIDPLLEQLGIGALWGEPGRTLTDSEGVDHQRLRRVVSPWFTARRIEGLRARTAELVDAALDAAAAHGDPDELDVMADLADTVPALLFCWMTGAPERDAPMLAAWSKALLSVFTAQPSMVEPVRRAKAELADHTAELLARKRDEPGDDLATMLATASAAGTIDEVDAFHLLEELLSASVDNTANTVGLAAYTLARHPEQWLAVHLDPTLVPAAVEECGRYEPAIRHTIKYAWADSELLGVPIPAGTFVTVRIAAAHRDPDRYESPHRLDVRRVAPASLLSFGAGRHYCLGAALGRMELQEMLAGLVRRWPGATVGADAELHIAASGHVVRLPLRRADAPAVDDGAGS